MSVIPHSSSRAGTKHIVRPGADHCKYTLHFRIETLPSDDSGVVVCVGFSDLECVLDNYVT